MKRLLNDRGLLSHDSEARIDSIISQCDCRFARNPASKQQHATQSHLSDIGETAASDFVFFAGYPFVHSIDRSSTRSVVIPVNSRKHEQLVPAIEQTLYKFKNDAAHNHPFTLLLADDEFDSHAVNAWAEKHSIRLQIAPTEGHEQNGCIEAASRCLRMFFNRLDAAGANIRRDVTPRELINQIVRESTLAKNSCTGNKVASAELLWTGCAPNFELQLDSLQKQGFHLQSLAALRRLHHQQRERARISRSSNDKVSGAHRIQVGAHVKAFRERDETWHGPFVVTNVHRNSVTLRAPNGNTTSCELARVALCVPQIGPENVADIEAAMQRSRRRALNTSMPSSGDKIKVFWPLDSKYYHGTVSHIDESGQYKITYDDGDIELLNLAEEDWQPEPQTTEQQPEVLSATPALDHQDDLEPAVPPVPEPPVVDTVVTAPHRLERPAQQPAKSAKQQNPDSSDSDSPEDGPTNACSQSFTTFANPGGSWASSPFRWKSPFATEEEKLAAYRKEKENWIAKKAFKAVRRNSLRPDANIIPSSTIYRYKPDGELKARIAPDGSRDTEKESLETFCPSMSLDAFRLLCSRAATQKWRILNLDAKGAFLQADGFDRIVYVTPPAEEGLSHEWVWLLLAAAYGLCDSGNLWYDTSATKLRQYGLLQSPLDPTVWTKQKHGTVCLLIVVQVNNYIITGPDSEIDSFASYLEKCLVMGKREYDTFDFFGMRLTRDPDRSVILDSADKISDLVDFPSSALAGLPDDAPAPMLAKRFAHYTVGLLLFLGRTTIPIASIQASFFGQRLNSLTVANVRDLRSEITRTRSLPSIVYFKATNSSAQPRFVAFSDASFYREPKRAADARIGWIICIYYDAQNVHIINWASHRLKRVAHSAPGAEAQAAVESSGAVVVGAHLAAFMGFRITSPSKIVVDNLGNFKSLYNQKRNRDGLTTLDLLVIKDRISQGLVDCRWMPGDTMPADPLTKKTDKIEFIISLSSRGILLNPPKLD